MEKLIENIVNIEWDMFSSTQNLGGQASCQQDRRQFEAMRKAQFLGWDEDSLNCYFEDLNRAKSAAEICLHDEKHRPYGL